MRAAFVVLAVALALPFAAAEPVRQCTSSGCVIANDTDGDGAFDWANVALIAGEQVVLNANLNRSVVLYEFVVTSEELGGHEAEEVIGETIYTVAVVGEANLTGPQGAGVSFADVLVSVLVGDHETGEQEHAARVYVLARDVDGDGAPDEVAAPGLLP